MFLSIGDRDLGLHSILTRGVRPHVEGKQRTPLSSRDRYLLEPTEWFLLCRTALVYISLYISEHRHSVSVLLCTQNRATRSLMLSMRRGSCEATQQLKNPTNCSFLTSDRARIAVALGSLETLDPNPSQLGLGSSSNRKSIAELRTGTRQSFITRSCSLLLQGH